MLTWPHYTKVIPRIEWHFNAHKGNQAAADVVMREYTRDGTLDMLVKAKSAYQMAHKGAAVLNTVSVVYSKHGNITLLHANKAVFEPKARVINLTGNVVSVFHNNMVTKTQTASYNTKTSVITSYAKVRVTHGIDFTTGIGFKVSTKNDTFWINKDVHSVYNQRSPKTSS